MDRIKQGTKIMMASGAQVTVLNKIGAGGQGVVYEAESNGKRYALKWYLREYLKNIDQKKFYENLADNCAAGAPSSKFLWPTDVSLFAEGSFGYLMPLRLPVYKNFSSILNVKEKFSGIRARIAAARNICTAFQSLHGQGYSYQDINNGNFFIDTKTGDVLICDNDNVSPYGTWMGMAGKDRYMAPEVVLRKSHAGMESDLYSLAVVLFMIFFVAHPLEGKAVHSCPCLTAKYMQYFYAEHPVFVYDPKDMSNRPVPGIDNNVLRLWKHYPDCLRALFERSFTKGLTEPGYRVRENEWIDCFRTMENLLITCPKCGGEQFYVRSDDNKTDFLCEDCRKKIAKPFLLQSRNNNKVLHMGELIRNSDISFTDDDSVIGKVVESKIHPGIWGIRIKEGVSWQAKYSNGLIKTQGKVIPIFKDTLLTIGQKELKIIV